MWWRSGAGAARPSEHAIEALINAVREGTLPPTAPELIGDLVGTDGQTLRQWVQEGRYQAYRASTLIVSSDTVEDYSL